MKRNPTKSRWSLSSAILFIILISAAFIAYSMLSFDTSSNERGDSDSSVPGSSLVSNTLRGYASILSNTLPEHEGSASNVNMNKKQSTNHNHVHSDIEVMKCPSIGGDDEWCSVRPPSKSHFGFDNIEWDERRWKRAQIQASSGEQVLLEKVIQQFPHPYDYIDGDRSFRNLQKLVDIFVDSKTGLDPLLPDHAQWSPVRKRRNLLSHDKNLKYNRNHENEIKTKERSSRRALGDEMVDSGETTKGLHVNGKQLVPYPYNYRISNRAPVVEMGYTAFDKDLNTFFSGNFAGGNFVKKEWFFDKWNSVKDQLDHPFITMCALNENWGVLSTNFPNRTAGWGACCNKPSDANLHKFLDHEHTLMFIINQHSNISHPKLLTIPRGLPTQWEHTARVVWDTQREVLRTSKKQKLLFAASSSWGKRPQILRCISNKMNKKDFWGHSDASEESKAEAIKTKASRRLYYQKLGTAMIGVALPGLGYDCFRTWELLTMGSMVVIERGVGLDRTLWRLPALLVEDFDEITPELLRSAYVEALYRVNEFEFERLTQSFWYSVIYNVSDSHSVQPMLDKFPMRAELPNFARPKVPYSCSNAGTCGAGTKRTPKNYC
jgi:hypothetical protein